MIPGIADARGMLNGKINADGTVSSPNLTGSIKITDGSLFVSTTGMNYLYALDAVSYTHLDVYKRQGKYSQRIGSK